MTSSQKRALKAKGLPIPKPGPPVVEKPVEPVLVVAESTPSRADRYTMGIDACPEPIVVCRTEPESPVEPAPPRRTRPRSSAMLGLLLSFAMMGDDK